MLILNGIALLAIISSCTAGALPHQYYRRGPPIKCPIIFDGRVRSDLSLSDFDDASRSPYSTKYVKGENLTWSEIIRWPVTTLTSRFDSSTSHKPFQVTIDNNSLFRSGAGLQTGFRRAGLLLKDDLNAPGADPADNGKITFHWSVHQEPSKPLNLTHEYMNVWHERADYQGNQFTFAMGLLLPVDGGDGINTREKRESFKVQDRNNKIIFSVPIHWSDWQNFAVQLDYQNSTIQVFYSQGWNALKAVTKALPNDNTGGGQMQLGMAKKPTETETVVWDGYQEVIKGKEAQTYGGVFVEDSTNGCISV